MSTTTSAPTAARPAAGAAAKPAVPDGAARMQNWYIDRKGRRVKGLAQPVPVNADNERTPHVRHYCKTSGCKQVEWILPKGKQRFCPDHGKPLAPAGEGRKVLAREVLALHGASALPWLALLALAAAAVVVQVADLAGWRLAVAAPVVYAIGYWVGRLMWRRRPQPPEVQRRASRRLGLHVGLVVAWLALAAAGPALLGWPGNLAWVALVAVWWARAHQWWKQVDARRARPAPKPQVLEIEAGATLPKVLQDAVDTWAKLIGKPAGVLGDTYLTDLRLLPPVAAGGPTRPRKPNLTATVRSTVPGAVNMREHRPRLLGAIATAFGVSGGDVSFAADHNDLSVAYLRVCPDNPLAEVRHYTGPDPDDWRRGWSTVGWFDDGEPLVYAWWNEIGAVHALISGCTGSGKSELVVQLILRSLHSRGLVMDWLGDPQGGQSYGAVKEHVAWFAPSKADIRLMLIAAMKEMDRRTKYLSDNYIKTWRATVDMPLIVITLDEVQRYIDDAPIVEMIQNLVGQGRKAGIALRLITQVPASYALGGTVYIKEQLLAGQTFTFRAQTRLAGRHASEGDDMVDPADLPKRWGMWTCGEGKTTAGLCFVRGVYGRDLFARVAYTGEDMTVWLHDAAGDLTVTPGDMSAEAQAVAGVLWTGRHHRARLTMSGARDDRSLLSSADAEALIAEAQLLHEAGYDPSRVATPDNASGDGLVARDLVHHAAATSADANGGIATRQAITDLTPDMATSTRDGAIGDLVAGGILERVKNGQYRVLRRPPGAPVAAKFAQQIGLGSEEESA